MEKNESINIYRALLLDYLKVLYKIVLCFFQVSSDNALRTQTTEGKIFNSSFYMSKSKPFLIPEWNISFNLD